MITNAQLEKEQQWSKVEVRVPHAGTEDEVSIRRELPYMLLVQADSVSRRENARCEEQSPRVRRQSPPHPHGARDAARVTDHASAALATEYALEAQRRLADEQAALRKVATLVAAGAPPDQVFQAVTEEVCRLLGIGEAVLERFVDAETGTVVGRFGTHMVGGVEIGTTLPIEDGLVAWRVLHTGAPARVDSFEGATGELAARIHALGYRAAVGVPIVVAASTWGTLVAAVREGESLPPETEQRLQAFAELVALAVASAQARDELEASRMRVVEASDAERRRLERNLHDGAQQRLVALAVGLRLAQGKIREAPDEAAELLAVASEELMEALTELRELAQGIHPAVLTERGLEAALEVLAARARLPVELEVRLAERLPARIETAAYYVVSEALANVVKHSGADSARVWVERAGSHALIEVTDDGVGGADSRRGSGLRGLRDRVGLLDGRVIVESNVGRGTLVRAELPLLAREGDGAAAAP